MILGLALGVDDVEVGVGMDGGRWSKGGWATTGQG